MFEMLGNFSFGDYFKAEAIPWAHELVTEGYGIDHDLLWVTVYEDDAEAEAIWIDAAGSAPERIVRRGRLDSEGQLANYWHTHAAGPGGPVLGDLRRSRARSTGPTAVPTSTRSGSWRSGTSCSSRTRSTRTCEIVGELPAKNIDTGSSLERVATLLQGMDNYFETDALPSAASRWSSRCRASGTAPTRTTTSRSR